MEGDARWRMQEKSTSLADRKAKVMLQVPLHHSMKAGSEKIPFYPTVTRRSIRDSGGSTAETFRPSNIAITSAIAADAGSAE